MSSDSCPLARAVTALALALAAPLLTNLAEPLGGAPASRPFAVSGAPPGDFDDFPAYLYLRLADEAPLPGWARAIGGVNAARGHLSPAADGLPHYAGLALGRDELHLDRAHLADGLARWRSTRLDADLPPRPFDLADPAVLARLEAHARGVLERCDDADFFALGDEVGVTPWGDPIDFAGERGPSTDTALGLLDGPDLAGFRARRTHAQATLLAALDHGRAVLREDDAARALGLMGNGPRTPFGGIAASDLVRRFEVLEPYPAGSIRAAVFTERHAADAVTEQVLRTVFTESAAATAWQVWEHALRGGDGVVVWSRDALEARGDAAASLLVALDEVRAWRAAVGAVDADESPRVVVLTDETSDAAAWLATARRQRLAWPRRLAGFEAEHGPAFARRGAWRQAFDEAGHPCGALEVARLAAHPRVRLAVATGLDLARPEVLAALTAFVERGGTLLLDTARGADADAFPKGASGRVVAGGVGGVGGVNGVEGVNGADGPGGASVERARDDLGTPRALRLRDAVRAIAASAGLAPPPAEIVAHDGRPLLTAWRRAEGGDWIGVAIESVDDSPSGRRGLAPWHARVRGVETGLEAGFELAWIARRGAAPTGWHEERGLLVGAGEAAVVRLRRRAR